MKQISLADSLHVQDSTMQNVIEDSVQSLSDTSIQVPVVTGMQGEPMPYKMESDEAVIGAVLFCFVLILLALQRGSKSVIPYLKEAVTVRNRAGFYEEKVALSSVSSAALCFSTILTSGICLYRYYASPLLPEGIGHLLVLMAYICAFAVLIVGKYLLYDFVNWIFFNKEKNQRWKQSYWGLIAAAGVVLFPSVLFAVFLDSEIQISDYLLLMILVIFKILLFYKLIGNFFVHFYGILHLILYFCALEIIPDLLLWKGVEIFNNLFLKL